MATLASSSERDVVSLVPDLGEGVADCVTFPQERSRPIRLGVLATAAIAGLAGAALSSAALDRTEIVSALLLALAVAGGLLSTWSPCGYSSLSLLRPIGRYSAHSLAGFTPTFVIHGLGYLGGALVLGGLLGLGGHLIGLSVASSGSLIVLGLIGVLYGAHQLGFVRVPYPQRRAQVPHDARQRFPIWVIGGLYGFSLGLNYLTYVQTPILYLVTAAAALSGQAGFAIALFLAFNAGRFLPMLANYLPVTDIDVQDWLARRQESAAVVDGALLVAAGAALLALAAL